MGKYLKDQYSMNVVYYQLHKGMVLDFFKVLN